MEVGIAAEAHELAFRPIERVAQRYVHVGVSGATVVVAVSADLTAWNGKGDPDGVRLASITVRGRSLDRYMASCDSVMKALQSVHQFPNAGFECCGTIDVPKDDLQWRLHTRVLDHQGTFSNRPPRFLSGLPRDRLRSVTASN